MRALEERLHRADSDPASIHLDGVELGSQPLDQPLQVGGELTVEVDLSGPERPQRNLARGEEDRQRAALLMAVGGDVVTFALRSSEQTGGW